MAQVTGGSDYDLVWDEKVEAALALVREVSDAAAMERTYLPEDFIIAALLKTLAYPVMPKIRKLKEWDGKTGTVTEELTVLNRGASTEACKSMEFELRQILSQAILGWEEGDPENPQTQTVFNNMVSALFEQKFIRNPPRP